ncbi:FKBP-type peptidyl-prolyl cis-trans isomerase [Ekhidna sp.]|uniref:FKBP-type peptidyl-prolyl cis-trans isomerase n=1 Tax=Ekhidna sp. TaxID=2608089 RepID=UPI003297B8F5
MKNILLLISILFTLMLSGCLGDNPDPSLINEEQLALDIQIIDDYLEDNNIVAEVHESGIRYAINNEGSGDSPIVGDRIVVKFTGYDLQGNVFLFDTLGLTVELDQFIIRSWALMLPEIKEDGMITIYSPSGYAYGASGNSLVDPNEVVVFEIELLAIIKTAADQQAIEESIIDEYLTENSIDFQTHESGIRYTIIEEGSGDSPTINDIVSVTYKGYFLNGEVFDSNSEPISFELQRLIRAWQIIIPVMKEGGKIKFYSPSGYCYGTTGSNIIPPNTILAFEIELDAIQ